jgi:hypothetical protein
MGFRVADLTFGQLAPAAVAVVIASCSPVPTAPASGSAGPPTPASATISPTLSPIASPVASHGQPYDPTSIISLLAAGPPRVRLPPELQTDEARVALAAALATSIWTYDGQSYRELWVHGSCNEGGAFHCEITVSGLPGFVASRDDQDTWWFEVRSGTVRPISLPQLRGRPGDLDAELDGLVRTLDERDRLVGLSVLSVEWLLPPPDDGYLLRYGTGGEEGSPRVIVALDRLGRQLLGIQQES